MIKTVHIATVLLSLVLFVGRGSWIYLLRKQLTARWIRILPHVNDSILLVSGITLAVQTGQSPLLHNWLAVKIACLLVYILLGMLAMKWFRATRTGLFTWLAAIIVYLFMLSVALNRNSAGFFG